MSLPFLKTDKFGVAVRFPKALYPGRALPQVQEALPKGALAISEDGRYVTLRLKGGSEQDGYELCERFFYLSKNARQA
jgi:hypothetical protein